MDYLLGGSLGGIVAFAFALPAIVLEIVERGKVKRDPLVIDVKTIFGVKIKHRHEVFLIGLLLYLVVGFLFGLVYIVFVEQGWLFVTGAPFTLLSLFVYALLSWIVAGIVLYPLLGMGMFALKEGKNVWLETLISHILLGLGLWLLVQYYQPYYFNVVL
jgi:hypothetical protein